MDDRETDQAGLWNDCGTRFSSPLDDDVCHLVNFCWGFVSFGLLRFIALVGSLRKTKREIDRESTQLRQSSPQSLQLKFIYFVFLHTHTLGRFVNARTVKWSRKRKRSLYQLCYFVVFCAFALILSCFIYLFVGFYYFFLVAPLVFLFVVCFFTCARASLSAAAESEDWLTRPRTFAQFALFCVCHCVYVCRY